MRLASFASSGAGPARRSGTRQLPASQAPSSIALRGDRSGCGAELLARRDQPRDDQLPRRVAGERSRDREELRERPAADDSREDRALPGPRPRQVARAVLAEDRALELLQHRRRRDAELVDECAAGGVVSVERLRLPTRAIERE